MIEDVIKQLRVAMTRANIDELARVDLGATAVKMKGPVDEALRLLREEANKIEYWPSMANTPTGVRQNFNSCSDFGAETIWAKLAAHVSVEIATCFKKENCRELISWPLCLQDLAVQHYPKSAEGEDYGISPHRDQAGFINLVAVLLLCGPSTFFVCRDKQGTGSVEIVAKPGELIIMRAGEFGTAFATKPALPRPFHYVGKIEDTDGRTTFGMRQITSDPVVREKILAVFGK